jgi:hypothetical protein
MSVKVKSLLILVVLAAVSCCLFVFKLANEKRSSANVSNESSQQKIAHQKEFWTKKQDANFAIISPSKSTLAHEYSTTQNLRGFVESGRNRAHEGAYYYIFDALKNCEHLAKAEPKYDPKEDGKIYSKRIEIAKFWVTRCQNLIETDLEFSYRKGFDNEAPKKKDFLYELEHQFYQPEVRTNRQRFRDSVKRWLAAKDPLLLESNGQHIMSIATEADTLDMWFEGRLYPASESANMAQAWYLVPCAFGYVCDQNDFRLASACINQGFCYKDRFDFVRSTRPVESPNEYQIIYGYYQRIVAAIQRQDVDAFVKPDGVP